MKAIVSDSVSRKRKVLLDYEKKRHYPSWYRGQSDVQLQGLQGLLNSLRDDIEQGTIHRVRNCLIRMGLSPMVKYKDIRKVINLSGGNDLIFIYFLNELYYRVPDDQREIVQGIVVYTENEQLLMTAIYHLDVIPTLRELDRILPPGHPSLRTLKRREEIAKAKAEAKAKARRLRKERVKSCSSSPYFNYLVMPKPYGKSLWACKPPLRISFNYYENYSNPNYIVPNWDSRWFENYTFNPKKRAAKSIMDHIIPGVFRKHQHNRSCIEEYNCEQFKLVREIELILDARFPKIEHDACLKVHRIGSSKWNERLDTSIAQLQNDIEEFLKNYVRLREKTNNSIVEVNHAGNTSVYFESYEDMTSYLISYKRIYTNERRKTLFPGEIEPTPFVFANQPRLVNINIEDDGNFTIEGLEKPVNNEPMYNVLLKCGECIEELKKCEKCGVETPIEDCKEKKEDVIMEQVTTNSIQDLYAPVNSREIFFTAPTKNMPYNFKYQKIFEYTLPDKQVTELKKAFLSCLNKDLMEPYFFRESEGSDPDLGEASKYCAQHYFYQLAEENKESEHSLFSEKYYDCEDSNLMKSLVKEAFRRMRENRKLVLVTLPEAENVGTFLEFVKRRYGKVYTSEERKQLLKESKAIFDALVGSIYETHSLQVDKKFQWIQYSYVHCLKQEFKPALKSFYEGYCSSILNRARVFWLSCRPFYAAYIHTRNAFYSYTPSKSMDIKFFRVWKPHEYRDMSNFSRKRYFKIQAARGTL